LAAVDASPAARRRAIDTAFSAPFPEQGLPVEFTTYVLRGPAAGAEKIVLAIAADIPALQHELQHPGSIDVVFAVQDVRTGRVIASGTDTLRVEASPGDAAGASGICRVQFEAPPGDYVARVVVREPGGLVGSADRRFQVRDLHGPALGASDLVIGSKRDAVPVRLRVSSAEMLTGAFELYGRVSEQLRGLDVRVALSRIGEDVSLRTVHADLLDIEEGNRGVTGRTALIEMPLSGIEPGRYLVRAEIRPSDGAPSALTREIEVTPDDRVSVRTHDVDGAHDRRHTFVPADLLEGVVVRRYLSHVREAAPAAAGAVALAMAGAWDKAEASIVETPSTAGVRGLARLARHDYDGAATLFSEALADDERSASAAFFLGWAQFARGSSSEAISAWRRAAFLDPTLISAHLALADAYVDLGERGLAIQALRSALAALPKSPEIADRLWRIQGRQ
jgi:hypothetical protein